ncbi:MAG: imidazole glycerol phosphate synthase subunit HisH [Thermomicrobiales bacterium]|nr:imidazole glycerol phosphate synthase subunit HisH [Thermomicrobiales bacterium]MCO5228030.1 imidazole glycerol phosphate synthase subunit HisH [Thermomicrobiales bacterium]
MIAIIDYGAGNLRSILRAIESQGGQATITGDPDEIIRADRVVLPGVGNAKAAMEQLISTGIADAVKEQAERGTPLLGVCLGMQLLFGEQEEGPTTGLSLIPGKGVKLSGDHKIPHMGWNTVRFTDHSPLAGRQTSHYYFVHSYVVVPDDPTTIAGITEYGQEFASVVIHDHIWGTQFHPEKSHTDGLDLIGAWLAS